MDAVARTIPPPPSRLFVKIIGESSGGSWIYPTVVRTMSTAVFPIDCDCFADLKGRRLGNTAGSYAHVRKRKDIAILGGVIFPYLAAVWR